METNLRPLSLGEILDRTAYLYRSNFLLFAGISAIYSGVVLILGLVNIGLVEVLHLEALMKSPQWLPLTLYGVYILFMILITFAFGGVSVAANNRAVAWVHLGEPATIRAAYSSILPRLGRYLWLMTIIAFVAWTPFALLYGGYLGAILFYAMKTVSKGFGNDTSAGPEAIVPLVIISLIFVVLLIAALIYAILMTLRYSLALPACVVENLPARKAIRRSIELSKGSRGRIFVLGLLVAIIEIGLVGVAYIFFIIAAFKSHGQLSVGMRVAQQVVAFFTNAFIGPIYATGLTLFYYDQRIRKEGFDIEWMMQAAGLTASVPETKFTAQADQPFATETLLVEPAATQDAVSEPATESGSAHE